MNRFVFCLLTLCLFAATALAQSQTGNLTGTVSDPSGVIQGATVVVKDNGTGRERTAVTSDSGSFTVPQLPVGAYTVTITAAGHKTYTATDLKIDVSKDYSLNVTLEVGDIKEQVTVVAGADLINATDAQLSNTVSARQIVELPLNGRNPLSLVLLQPGTSSNSANSTTINGQRPSFTNITRDGINVQDNFIRTNAVDFIPDRPNVDDTGEFTIITSNAGAELGYGSSQVQLVTPRGSNEFHGALYEYNRNSRFAANSFFNNFSGVPRPFLNRNQFGGKVSGPIWKNHIFFFFAYEDFRLNQGTTVNRTILRPDARNGIFTYRDNSGVVRTRNIFTLASGLAGGPPTGIDPTIQSRILANVPTAGNNPTLGDQFNTIGLTFSRANNQTRKAFSNRVDWDITDRQSLNGVWSYKKEYLMRNDVEAQQGGTACCYTTTPTGFQDAHTPFIALAHHWSPTATLTNELRGGWQASNPTFGSTAAEPAFFLTIPLINNPEIGFQAQGRDTTILNIQDNAVWTRGSHSIRIGGQFQAFTIKPFGPGAFGAPFIPNYTIGVSSNSPQFTVASFNTAAGCVAATGVNCISTVGTANNLLALLGGMISGANQTFTAAQKAGTLAAVPPSRELLYENYGFYIADQWRVGPRLTLNLGLRYDLFSPIREKNGLLLEPVQNGRDMMITILDPNGTYDFLGVNGRGNNFFNWDKNNLAPVVSFAYSPTFRNNFLNSLFPGEGRTVLRGGFRISYVNDEFARSADNALLGNAGLTSSLSVPNGFASSALNARLSGPLPAFTAPAVVVPRTYVQNNAQAGNFGTVFAIDPDLKVPNTREFNIGIEREIGWQTAIEARFVHGSSNNLVRGLDFNQVRLFDNGYLADFNRARSNLILTLAARQTNPAIPVSIGPNALVPGTVPLTVISTLAGGGLPTNATIINLVQTGVPADLAFTYVANNIGGSSALFLRNPNTGVVDLLTNAARYNYNALQTEIRRRFSKGLTFQANYTFQKSLTDAPGTGQTRFEPLIDNAQPNLEYSIADSDTTHVFNFNAIYELPFGKGKTWFGGAGPWLERLVGGWQLTSILRIDSAAPFSITDPRGTLNRAGRAGRQTASTNLSKDEVKALAGVFRTPCGIFYLNPQVINIDLAQCQNGVVAPRIAGTTAGVASLGFDPIGLPGGVKTFPGQVFFNVGPGQVGNMERNFLHGPTFFNWDASIIKNIRITERVRFQIRGEAFNVLNRPTFTVSQSTNINSSTFGRSFGAFPGARVVQFVGRLEF